MNCWRKPTWPNGWRQPRADRFRNWFAPTHARCAAPAQAQAAAAAAAAAARASSASPRRTIDAQGVGQVVDQDGDVVVALRGQRARCRIGPRYPRAILEVDGSCPTMDSFKALRSCEPVIDALLRHQDLS